MVTKKEIIAKLKLELMVQMAQDICQLKWAYDNMIKLRKVKFMGSGVIVTITDLRGDAVVGPVCIEDGLSEETIVALRAEILRTQNDRIVRNKITPQL